MENVWMCVCACVEKLKKGCKCSICTQWIFHNMMLTYIWYSFVDFTCGRWCEIKSHWTENTDKTEKKNL